MSMEEDSVSSGDEAILRRLLSLDWMSIPDHVTSLSHIDAEVLVHIIARALQRVNSTETQVRMSAKKLVRKKRLKLEHCITCDTSMREVYQVT